MDRSALSQIGQYRFTCIHSDVSEKETAQLLRFRRTLYPLLVTIIAALMLWKWPSLLKTVQVTVSTGISSPGKRHNTPEKILKAAGKILYRAKKTGRNRVLT